MVTLVEKIGILVISYGSRGAAIIDAFRRSDGYRVKLYIVDRNRNPFNIKHATRHIVLPDLNPEDILTFAQQYHSEIDFGIVGPEKPIIAGVRDLLEQKIKLPMICPMKEYALEHSKIAQRRLLQEIAPEINPRFRVFDPREYSSINTVKKAVLSWLNELNNQVAIKPDGVTAGKGVGVWGDHFTDRSTLFDHFLSNYQYGPVIIEEKVVGEEASFQCFCDGKHLVPLPDARDYKRAFQDDKGPNTGGMGAYKAPGDHLPFMTPLDREREVRVTERIFQKLKGRGSNPGIRGVPLYGAFIHTAQGSKLLELNSRPGDPEIMNLLPILQDDFVDVCLKMLDGSLTQVTFTPQASVVIYKVPPTYGGKQSTFSGSRRISLRRAEALCTEVSGRLVLYPGAMEIRDNQLYSLSSRTVAVVGVADDISTARALSLQGIKAIEGALWYRPDIASKQHITNSINHMKRLRTR
jgi:phosphoribosylamine--glycine ligase